MVLAFLGGFLQQLLGPRKMLLAAGLPGLLSWLVVVVPAALKVSSSHTVPFLLMSRCTFCTFQSFIFSKLYFCPNSQNTCRSLQLLLDGQCVHGGHSTQPSCCLLQADRGAFDLFITNFHPIGILGSKSEPRVDPNLCHLPNPCFSWLPRVLDSSLHRERLPSLRTHRCACCSREPNLP